MFRLGSKVVIAVTEEQFDREKRYQASMNMFRTMLKNGLITNLEMTLPGSGGMYDVHRQAVEKVASRARD